MDVVFAGTLNDQTQSVLRDRILSGTMAPGSRILEVELADELGVGRGTLRSALQQLSAERLVVQKRFHSTYVASATATDVFETYTLRNALESLACRLAADRITADGARRLRDVLAVMASAVAGDDRAAVVDADYALHRTIIDLAQHTRLAEHYLQLEAQTRLFLNLTSGMEYDLPSILETHTRLAEAVIAGDADLAAALGGAHNTADGERITRSLVEKESTPA